MIRIWKSETADTRTCDYTKVSEEKLLQSSFQHIGDIKQGLGFFSRMIEEAAEKHDHDKISGIAGFHRDFATGFKKTSWWDNHRKVNRHHLDHEDGIPEDVNLIDVLDRITDCVMAGLARSGKVSPVEIDDELLQRAFQNTVELLKKNVELVDRD